MATWQLQEAKARFSELVRSASADGPQVVTVRGEPAVVVISQDEYQRIHEAKPAFVDFIRGSPMAGGDLQFERDKSITRPVDI